MFSLPFGQGLCFVNVFLAVFICVCLSVKKRATGKNVFFAAEEPIFSPTVLRFERFGHSANESLTSSAFRPCGYSHCLFMSVSVCSCCLCADGHVLDLSFTIWGKKRQRPAVSASPTLWLLWLHCLLKSHYIGHINHICGGVTYIRHSGKS